MIYLALKDKEIDERQAAVHSFNSRIIEDFEKKSLWYRFWNRADIEQQVMQNWTNFNRWMNLRITQKGRGGQ